MPFCVCCCLYFFNSWLALIQSYVNNFDFLRLCVIETHTENEREREEKENVRFANKTAQHLLSETSDRPIDLITVE